MAKLRFLWNNLIDQGILGASSEDTEFPVENIQNELFLKHWRALGYAGEWVCVDLSGSDIADNTVRAWAIKYHNLSYASGDDYAIQASAVDLCGSGGPGSGELNESFAPTPEICVGFFASDQIFNSWRFLLDSSGSKAGIDYQKIGRLFLGDYFEPTYDPSVPPTVEKVDDSPIVRSSQGQDYATIVAGYDIVTYRWGHLPAQDIAALEEIYESVGTHEPYFICEAPEPAATAYQKTRYVRNIEPWTFSPVVHGWGSVEIRVKTER